jgi:hypothetical protein
MNHCSSSSFIQPISKILLAILILMVFSCSPRNYTFRGKRVTEKQFNRKLNRLTLRYIKKNPEFVKLWNDVEVVYDTIPQPVQTP